jgi:hypothetical protein
LLVNKKPLSSSLEELSDFQSQDIKHAVLPTSKTYHQPSAEILYRITIACRAFFAGYKTESFLANPSPIASSRANTPHYNCKMEGIAEYS